MVPLRLLGMTKEVKKAFLNLLGMTSERIQTTLLTLFPRAKPSCIAVSVHFVLSTCFEIQLASVERKSYFPTCQPCVAVASYMYTGLDMYKCIHRAEQCLLQSQRNSS